MKIQKRSNRFRRSGFTLLEIVIVLGIIAVLLGGSIMLLKNVGNGAKLQRVDADFNAVGSALMTYKINAGNYPTTQQGLQALLTKPSSVPVPRRWTKLSDKMPLDPWKNPYGYRFPGKKNAAEYELHSNGPDAIENTEDDLSSQDE